MRPSISTSACRSFWPSFVLSSAVLLIVIHPGCAGDDLGAIGDHCPDNECGVNSAETTRLPISELHLRAGENTGDISRVNAQVVDFFAPDGATDYVLSVVDGQFVASRGDDTLVGEALIGARIHIANHNDDSATQIRFERYESTVTWTDEATLIDRYAFSFYAPGEGALHPICLAANDDIESDGAWSVVVSGERYDRASNQVLETGADATGWFSIACSGSALYKMKHMGYEAAPADPETRATTPLQRQATLKMLTADYCGNPVEEFTRDGTRLHWQNRDGWSHNNPASGGVLEAYWGPDGALCLDTPRLGARELNRVAEVCGGPLPTCAGFSDDYEWRTESPSTDM